MVLGLVRIPAKLKIKSCAGSTRGHSSWTGSSHRSHSPLCHSWSRSRLAHSSTRAHSSWTGSSHRSRSPLCHSWSRSRLAHSSTRACSSRRAHSSWSRSPRSWSHSLRNSQSSPWFWWVEGGVGQRSRWRERRCSVWGLLGQEPLYTCWGRCDLGTCSLPGSCSHHFPAEKF